MNLIVNLIVNLIMNLIANLIRRLALDIRFEATDPQNREGEHG